MTITASNRDWPEDRLDNDGQRALTCPHCTLTYIGKSTRIICKSCSTTYPLLPTTDP